VVPLDGEWILVASFRSSIKTHVVTGDIIATETG
jgi:hypothetical protein